MAPPNANRELVNQLRAKRFMGITKPSSWSQGPRRIDDCPTELGLSGGGSTLEDAVYSVSKELTATRDDLLHDISDIENDITGVQSLHAAALACHAKRQFYDSTAKKCINIVTSTCTIARAENGEGTGPSGCSATGLGATCTVKCNRPGYTGSATALVRCGAGGNWYVPAAWPIRGDTGEETPRGTSRISFQSGGADPLVSHCVCRPSRRYPASNPASCQPKTCPTLSNSNYRIVCDATAAVSGSGL